MMHGTMSLKNIMWIRLFCDELITLSDESYRWVCLTVWNKKLVFM